MPPKHSLSSWLAIASLAVLIVSQALSLFAHLRGWEEWVATATIQAWLLIGLGVFTLMLVWGYEHRAYLIRLQDKQIRELRVEIRTKDAELAKRQGEWTSKTKHDW